jgi:hypothetical protein
VISCATHHPAFGHSGVMQVSLDAHYTDYGKPRRHLVVPP